MRGSRKLCQWVSNPDVFCSWWGERGTQYNKNRVIISPPAKRHWNGVSLAGRWFPNIECWFVFQWIRTSIAKKPYISWYFTWGPNPPDPLPRPPPPLDPRMAYAISTTISCGVQNIYWCYKDLGLRTWQYLLLFLLKVNKVKTLNKWNGRYLVDWRFRSF